MKQQRNNVAKKPDTKTTWLLKLKSCIMYMFNMYVVICSKIKFIGNYQKKKTYEGKNADQ